MKTVGTAHKANKKRRLRQEKKLGKLKTQSEDIQKQIINVEEEKR